LPAPKNHSVIDTIIVSGTEWFLYGNKD